MVDSVEELAAEARQRALEKIYIWRAGTTATQALLSAYNLSHTFCLQSGALVPDGCDLPAQRILDTLSVCLDEIDDRKLLPAVNFMIQRATDEGRAITNQHYQGFDFVTVEDESRSRPTAFMRNNAADMPQRIIDAIEQRRTLAYTPVEQVMRSERFVSSADGITMSYPTDEAWLARRAAADNAQANFVAAALAELPNDAYREAVFNMYRDGFVEVVRENGHNDPAARMLWAGKQAANATDGFEAGRDMEALWLAATFDAVVNAAAETGREITRYPVAGSTFLKIGSADSAFPRSFIRHNPVMAA